MSQSVVRQQGAATDSESCWLCFCWSPPRLLLLLTCKSKLTAWAAGPSAVLPSSHGHTTLPRTFRPTPNTPSYYLTHNTSFLSRGIDRCCLKINLWVWFPRTRFPRNLKQIMRSQFTQTRKGMKRYCNFCRLIFSVQFLNFIGTPHLNFAFDPKVPKLEWDKVDEGWDLWTNFPILRIPSLLQEYPEQ